MMADPDKKIARPRQIYTGEEGLVISYVLLVAAVASAGWPS
jgi:hypothetical protein